MLKTSILMLSLFAAGATATGCGAATFRADGFHPKGEKYSIRYGEAPIGEPSPSAILGADWDAINLFAKRGDWESKASDEYWEWAEYDTTGDGLGDRRVRERVYGLQLKHRVTGARIWISTIPLRADDAQTDLGVLLRRFSDELSRGVQIHRARFKGRDEVQETRVSTVEKRYAAKTLGERACGVSGQVAHSADIEIANVDQLEIDRSAARTRAHLVFVRPPYSRTRKDPLGRIGKRRTESLSSMSSRTSPKTARSRSIRATSSDSSRASIFAIPSSTPSSRIGARCPP
jgi:hypothetical protein